MGMNTTLRITREELRYWSRSRLGLAAMAVVLLLLVTSAVSTFVRVEAEREARVQLQQTAEETFRSQPARHPHRMVHYGHYVFRSPVPLATADPGVDPFTGTVMFLEGHKQNTATFAPQFTEAHAGPFASLSPALTYQLLVPLLLIVVGFSVLSREREARTDQLIYTMAVSPAEFWMGKSLALTILALVATLPLAVLSLEAWLSGESAVIALIFWLGYAVYLLCWVFLITALSVWSRNAASSLLALLACWVALSILLPRVASSTADAWAPLDSKVHNDLEIARVLRELGDGHNANDPAFAQLRAQLLAQYDVASVEELPVNFRGVVAETAEKELTDRLNHFAEQRMDQELAQVNLANAFTLLSPYLALKSFSIATASTDLRQHHRFVREAEDVRFSFVQGLNRVHVNELSYSDDINRNIDEASSQRARVDAHHWRVLDDFAWQPASAGERLQSGAPYLVVLFAWMLAAVFFGYRGAMRSGRMRNG